MSAKEATARIKINQLLAAAGWRFFTDAHSNLHYFGDLERGNPYVITAFPTLDSVAAYQQVTPDPANLPTGCPFHPRCAYAQSRCQQEAPVLQEIAPGHRVACLRAEELNPRGVAW